MKIFSDKSRAPHLGVYPSERLARVDAMPPLDIAPLAPPDFHRPDDPESIVNAMGEFQAMMDAIRGGIVNSTVADIPTDLTERVNHLKSFGYFSDASMVGI
ncbi:MAG: hypothetical protein ABJZ83_02595, partial [Yoonia sp.]|uniref:hypothetical protein n=1 Tax=Yoonia sp. TaxID=2212373 RepID=UPI003299B238